MLANHKLLLDQHCPLCQAYGSAFKKLKLVDSDTITYFQTVEPAIFDNIDQPRAKSEIALYNEKTGKTTYGIDSFLTILGHKSRFLQVLFKQKWFHWPMSKLYRFISFNRHVIAGHSAPISARACIPNKHAAYRWMYILLTAIFTGLIVNYFSFLLDTKLAVTHQWWREYAICFGQIGWQFILLTLLKPSKRLDYIGNMSTISFSGGFLLLPLFVVNYYLDLPWLLLVGGFGMVVFTMLMLHLKRCKNLGLPLLVSLSWVMYHTIALIFVLFSLN